ncbi:MAG: hypothetical protein ABH848_03690 [Candidatus Omnitrophota bacterium]
MRSILKIHNIMILIVLLTIVAIMYVNQQVLVYQMGLKVKENANIYSKLVDQNRILVYNVLNLKSPVNLEAKLLAKKVEMNMPHKWQVVRLKDSPEKFARTIAVKRGLFANLLSLGREAEASPNINSF